MNITFTHHALQRYRQRVCPELTIAETPAALLADADAADFSTRPPAWWGTRRVERSGAFLSLGYVVFPLIAAGREWVAVTAIPSPDDTAARRAA